MLAFTAASADFDNDPSPFAASWIQKENTFKYRELAQQWESPAPKRHLLGLVGGNEASVIAGNRMDIESDLRGTTRPLTNNPSLEHAPIPPNATTLPIRNRKTNMTINIRPKHLPEYQMWGYAGAYKPLPLVKETCGTPHKY
jgi:hypothetical protein